MVFGWKQEENFRISLSYICLLNKNKFMEQQKQEIVIPIKYSEWDPQDVLNNTYYNVEFTEDFGIFKKGEKYNAIDIDYSKGTIEAYSDAGELVKTQKFIAKPV